MKNTLTETELTPELKKELIKLSYSELKYDELEEVLKLNDFQPENMTSSNDACYCMALYYKEGKYVNVYVPNCKDSKGEFGKNEHEDDFDTYAIQCGETFEYLFQSKCTKEVLSFIQKLSK